MTVDIARPVRAGFVLYAAFPELNSPREATEVVDLVMAAGFAIVELSSTMPPDQLEAVATRVDRKGGEVYLSAGPELANGGPGLSDLSQTDWTGTLDRAMDLVDLAGKIQARNLMLVSGRDDPHQDRAARRTRFEESLRLLAKRMRSLAGERCTLSVESFPRESPPHQLLGPTEEVVLLLTNINDPLVRATIDLSHIVQLGEPLADSVARLSRHAHHMHLSTCITEPGHILAGDRHPGFDEPKVALAINEAGRAVQRFATASLDDPVVSVEVRRHHREAPDVHIRRCAQWLAVATGKAPP